MSELRDLVGELQLTGLVILAVLVVAVVGVALAARYGSDEMHPPT